MFFSAPLFSLSKTPVIQSFFFFNSIMVSELHETYVTPPTMSTTTTPTITTNPAMASSFFINLNFTLSIKLERGNYLIWKSQILPILRGHGPDGFVTGMKPCPNEFINVAGDSFGLNQMVNQMAKTRSVDPWVDDCFNVRRCCWSDCRLYHFLASLSSSGASFCLTFEGKITSVVNRNADNQERLSLND